MLIHTDLMDVDLKKSPKLVTTPEQDEMIVRVIKTASSDSQFVKKALRSIKAILSGTEPDIVVPVIASISPATAPVKSPPFDLVVTGTGFDADSQILLNGNPGAITVFTSDTELRTSVDLTNADQAATIRVKVANGDLISNEKILLVNEQTQAVQTPVKPEPAPVKK